MERAKFLLPLTNVGSGRSFDPRADAIVATVDPVVWMSEPLLRPLRMRLSSPRLNLASKAIFVSSAKEFQDATRSGNTVAFLDRTTIPLAAPVADATHAGPVVAVCDEPL